MRSTDKGEVRFWISILFLAATILALTGCGLVILTSAGQGTKEEAASMHYFYKQLQSLAFALGACGIAFFLPLEKFRRLVWPIFIVSCALMWAVHSPIGLWRSGSYRWIQIPGLPAVQVSDIAKIGFVFALALSISDAQRYLRFKKKRKDEFQPDTEANAPEGNNEEASDKPQSWTLQPVVRISGFPWVKPSTPAWREFISGFLPPLLVIGVMCVLIASEPDYGTLALFGAVGLLLFVVGGAKFRYLIPTLLGAVSVFCLLIYLKPDRMRRIAAFMDPEGMRLNEGKQVYQSMMALGFGGPTGVGVGNGLQQRHWLPEAHTDFIYAIIGEQMGIVGTAFVLLCFLAIYFVVVLNLRRAHNTYQFNICLGAMLFIVLQALLNMSVVTGLFPTTGVSLPFISFGGTGLASMFFLAGLIFNCLRLWRHPPAVEVGEIITNSPREESPAPASTEGVSQ